MPHLELTAQHVAEDTWAKPIRLGGVVFIGRDDLDGHVDGFVTNLGGGDLVVNVCVCVCHGVSPHGETDSRRAPR